MGRKKKTNTDTVKEETVKKQEIKTFDTLKYNGSVTISVKKNNKVISTKNFHNSGNNNLFKFFSYCLCGNYNEAESLRPTKIKLFTNTNEYMPLDISEINNNNIEEVSSFITYNDKPKTSSDQGNIVSILHFLIPDSYLFKNEIKEVRLYQKNTTTNDDYLARIFLYDPAKKVADETGYEWQELVKESDTNFTLSLDWKLSITNPTNENVSEQGGN